MLTICVVYVYLLCSFCCLFFFSSRRRHTRCALVTGVQTCALPIYADLAGPIKALIEEEPSFGYRTVAGLLDMNKNTVQRIFQIKGWQVRKRAVGKRPRIEALPSAAMAPAHRGATDDRKSVVQGKRGSVLVDRVGRGYSKKKKHTHRKRH